MWTRSSKIIHLQNIASQLLDAFTDLKRITKPHIPTKTKPCLKCGKQVGFKDKNPKKKKKGKEQIIKMVKF